MMSLIDRSSTVRIVLQEGTWIVPWNLCLLSFGQHRSNWYRLPS
jgi:hypothetical protein